MSGSSMALATWANLRIAALLHSFLGTEMILPGSGTPEPDQPTVTPAERDRLRAELIAQSAIAHLPEE